MFISIVSCFYRTQSMSQFMAPFELSVKKKKDILENNFQLSSIFLVKKMLLYALKVSLMQDFSNKN